MEYRSSYGVLFRSYELASESDSDSSSLGGEGQTSYHNLDFIPAKGIPIMLSTICWNNSEEISNDFVAVFMLRSVLVVFNTEIGG